VNEARFSDAKRLLMKVEGFQDYGPIRKAIEDFEAKQNRQLEKIKDLFNFVDERENNFLDLQGKLKTSIGECDLKKAIELLQLIDKRFPNPRNRERIRLYSELHESVEAIRRCVPEAVRRVLESGAEKPSSLNGDLGKVVETCDRILGLLPSEGFPALAEEVEERKSSVKREIKSILARKDELLGRLEEARRENRWRDELQALLGLLAIAETTDLMPPEEAGRFRRRQGEVGQVIERAEQRYREGLALMERKSYQAAQLEFEAAEREGPGLFADLREKIDECQGLAEKEILLINRLDSLYNRIMGDEVVPEDFKVYFQLLKQLPGTQEAETRLEWDQKAVRVITRLLIVEGGKLGPTSDDPDRLSVLSETGGILLVIPEDKLSSFASENNSELNERLLEFFGRFFAPFERSRVLPTMLEQRLEILRGAVSEMVLLKAILRKLKPLEYHTHPAEKASGAILACRVAALVGSESFERLGTLLALHEELKELVDDPDTSRVVEKNKRTLKRTRTRISLERSLHRAYHALKLASIPLATAIVVGVGGVVYHEIGKQDSRVSSAKEIIGSVLSKDVKIPAETVDAIKKQDLTSFLKPLLLVGPEVTPKEKTPEQRSEGSLVGWMALQKAQLDWLEKQKITTPKDLEAESWNGVIEQRITSILDGAGKQLEDRLKSIVRDALEIDPEQQTWFHLDRADVELKAFIELHGKRIDSVNAKDWTKRISSLRFEASKVFDSPPSEQSPSLLQLYHLAMISHCTRTLIWKNKEIYWTGEVPQDFISSTHELLRGLVEQRDQLDKNSHLKDLEWNFKSGLTPDKIRDGVQQRVKNILCPQKPVGLRYPSR